MTAVSIICMILGAGFLLVAAIGLVRLGDPLQRMHSGTKAGTLGTALLLGGVTASDMVEGRASAFLAVLFLLLTLPIGAQLLGRASYLSGTRLKGIEDDPLANHLDRPQPSEEDHQT